MPKDPKLHNLLEIKKKKLHVAPGKSYAHDNSENFCTEQSDDTEDVGLFTDDRDDDCQVRKNGKYLVNDFVVFKYIETLYPGRKSSIEPDGAKIQSMEKTKKFYRWLERVDEMFYVWKDIMMKIKPPKLVRRGFFRVEELEIYTE